MNRVRTPSRPALVGALLWVAVVVVVATLVWVVITRAGSGVANDEQLGDTGAPAPIGSNGSSSSEPTGPSGSTGPGGSTGPTESPATRTPSPSDPTTRANPDPKPVQQTARGAGGSVTVSCTGQVARLVAATPAGGYGAEVEESGPARVRVDFESEESRTRIEATCPGGSPAFAVEDDD